MSLYSKVLFSLVWQAFVFCYYSKSYALDAYVKTDILTYAQSEIVDNTEMKNNDSRSLSLINNYKELDKSEVTSFADAFLWASGARTILSTSEISRLNIVYLHDFPAKETNKIEIGAYAEIYEEQYNLIRKNGPCTRIDITSHDGKKYIIIYLDSKQSNDFRLSCVYQNFKSLYGLSEKYKMPDFSSTFVADLRMLRCIHKQHEIDVADALSSGKR